jgi:hypothetical protein
VRLAVASTGRRSIHPFAGPRSCSLAGVRPLAATGLILLMIGAMVTHARRTEYQSIGGNVILLLLAAVVWADLAPIPADHTPLPSCRSRSPHIQRRCIAMGSPHATLSWPA